MPKKPLRAPSRARTQLSAIAVLWVSAFFAVDGWTSADRPPVAIAPPSLATEAVYVAESAPPLPRSLPLSADAPLPDAAAAWIWSPDCALQRVEVLHRRELPCQPATQWLKIVVRPPPRWRKEDAPQAKVIVGPLEAWREIPEEDLPSWPLTATFEARVPVDGHSKMRLRVVGRGFGSSWQEVGASAPTIRVDTQDTKDLSVTVVGEGGEAAHEAIAAIFQPGTRREELWAITFGSDRGVVTLPALPGALRLAARFRADGLLPRRVEASVAHFPPRVPLAAGCPLEGRVTAEEGGPLADVSLRAEGLLPDGLIAGDAVQTDSKGRYRFPALPKAAVAVRLEAPGRETRIERYDLAGCRGVWTAPVIALAEAGVLRVHVVDEQGAGVTGAHVRSSTGPSGDSDAHGVATLAGIAKARSLTLTVQAKGFLPYDRSLSPPIPATTELRLARAASLHGVLVDEAGGAVSNGEVVIAVGNSTKSVSAGDDGAFESDVTPGVVLEIRAGSPATAERRERLQPLAAGEDRDLGQLVLTRGFEVLGRVVAADSGEPVSGALVWAARGGSAAALVKWAQGATARSNTAGDGTFRLAGLPFAPTTVRVEAAGFAPAERPAAPVADASQVTLGDIALASGGTIEVHADRTLNGIARADWRGDWREDHMISASLVEGEAVIDHVPPGDSHVSVVADGEVACDGSVAVADGDVVEFDCDDARLQVDGIVSVGGHGVGPGSLVWLVPVAADSLILNHRTALGLVQQQVFGAGRPQVSIDVDTAGAFLSDQLSGGDWTVLWAPTGGGGTLQRDVTLPRVGPVHLDLDFPGGSVQGMVHDRDGKAVGGARVVDTASGSTTRSGDDGSYRLDGLPAGVARLRAFAEQRSSAVVEVPIGTPESGDQLVELIVEDSGRFRLSVLAGERPADGAVVFVEAAGSGMRLWVADSRGEVEIDARSAPAFRATAWYAGRWVLGPWVPADIAATEGYRLSIGDVGELRVSSTSATGDLEVAGPDGWALTVPLRQMGQILHISPGREILLAGLPAGTYQLSLGTVIRSATIDLGDEAPTASFP